MRVLVVDELDTIRTALTQSLAQAGLGEVRAVAGSDEAVNLAAGWQPDTVILEVKRRDGHGIVLCSLIRLVAPQTLIIIATSYHDPLERLTATQAGADAYLMKDVNPSELMRRILRVGVR